jgi:hypothetical protein
MSKRFGVSQWLGVILLALVVAVLAYVFLVRPLHMRWGATDEEVSAALPGDPWITAGAEVSTRSITIHAPVSQVCPGWPSWDRARRVLQL